MMLALLLAGNAIDAERAFALDAQKRGQWTAFRATATDDAFMFVPLAQNAQDFLKPLTDPPRSLQWWPSHSWVACDGGQAVNTGPWISARGDAQGYFSTVWVRQPDGGWKWVMDGGDELAKPRPAGDRAKVVAASCQGRPTEIPAVRWASGQSGEGRSADRTLQWRWHVFPDGARQFDAWLWDGRKMRPVKSDRIAAPPPKPA